MKATIIVKRITSDDVGRLLPVPLYEKGLDEMNRMKEGAIRQMEIKNPRNLRKHNMLMAELRMMVDTCVSHGINKWSSVDDALLWLKEMLHVEKSISFSSMDEDEFTETVFEPAQPIIAHVLNISVVDLQSLSNLERYMK